MIWHYMVWNDIWHKITWQNITSHDGITHDMALNDTTWHNMIWSDMTEHLRSTNHEGMTWCSIMWDEQQYNKGEQFGVLCGVGQMFAAVWLTVLSADCCSVNDVLVCVGTLSTVSGWSDECGSCTERALWPVARSLYNSLHFQGQMTAK